MQELKARFSDYYYSIINSIGFYPTIISIFFFIMGIGMLTLDFSDPGMWLKDQHNWLEIGTADTARAILSTLIAGIISLTVLSFSMVMVVINQATTTLSPKVILGLVSEKSHQTVLGIYLGTIIFSLIVLLATRNPDTYLIPSLSILMGMGWGITCLALFVFFIHRISLSIQLTTIIDSIHEQAKRELKRTIKEQEQKEILKLDQVALDDIQFPYPAPRSGYLQNLNIGGLVAIASENDLIIRMNGYVTEFFVEGMPLFYLNKPASELAPHVQHGLVDQFIFYTGEKISQNYTYGFTQLMEIAIKAMSPGINDPGTCVTCVHYLSDLFALHYHITEPTVFPDQKGNVRVISKKFTFENYFNFCFTPIRQYGGRDISIARALLQNISRIAFFDKTERRYQGLLNDHAVGVIVAVKSSLHNQSDLEALNDLVNKMNKMEHNYFRLPLIAAKELNQTS